MEPHRQRFRAMGSPCEVRLHSLPGVDVERVAVAAQAEVERLERKYTRYRDDSLTARINASAGDPAGVEVDAETAALLDYAAEAHRTSGGAFDPTSGPLRRVWDFRATRVPRRDEVEAVLPRIGWHRLRWERPLLVLPEPGMEIDFGGFVKEYAADRAAERCRQLGARHGLVDLGGDLALVGPHPDGSPWRVGIRDPRRPDRPRASVALVAGAIATSGDYERCMVVDGRRYSHLLDPRSGWPVEGLACVSVAAPLCLVAGTASTVAMLLGARGREWLTDLPLPHLWVDPDGDCGGPLAPPGDDQLGGEAGIAHA